MGLSSLPSPSEGMLCVLLVNTALSISIFKGIVRSILHIVGIHLSSFSSSSSSSTPSPDYPEDLTESSEFPLPPSDAYIREFRSKNPATRFETMCSYEQSQQHDCSVCLTQFEPDSEINCLSCGHFFHKACLEKWLDYWNVTCPLCRSHVMPGEDDASCFWWAYTQTLLVSGNVHVQHVVYRYFTRAYQLRLATVYLCFVGD